VEREGVVRPAARRARTRSRTDLDRISRSGRHPPAGGRGENELLLNVPRSGILPPLTLPLTVSNRGPKRGAVRTRDIGATRRSDVPVLVRPRTTRAGAGTDTGMLGLWPCAHGLPLGGRDSQGGVCPGCRNRGGNGCALRGQFGCRSCPSGRCGASPQKGVRGSRRTGWNQGEGFPPPTALIIPITAIAPPEVLLQRPLPLLPSTRIRLANPIEPNHSMNAKNGAPTRGKW